MPDLAMKVHTPQSELEKRWSSTNSARSWRPEAPGWRGWGKCESNLMADRRCHGNGFERLS